MTKIDGIRSKMIGQIKPQTKAENVQQNTAFKSSAVLPSFHSAGVSMVNADVPISYSKIGEIEIPGLKDKASVYKLANGQKVIIAPKKGPTMIKTAYNVGALNETDDIRGMSHYIEHSLFNGSKNLAPREYDSRLSDLGGYTNANTDYAITNYFLALQLLSDDSLEEAIKLNAMQTQFPTFPQAQLEKEKEPVKSEIDMYKDNPFDNTRSQVVKDLFGINTQASNLVLGTKENINSFTREKVLDYYNTWYTPDNAVTVITGDVDPDETMRLVSKYYNKQNDYSNVNKRHQEPIKYNDKPIRHDFISPNATNPCITMGFAIPEGTSKQDLKAIEILIKLLKAPNSALSKRMDKLGAKIDIAEEKMQNRPDGARALEIDINTTEENVEEVLKIVYDEITRLSANPPSIKDLDTIRTKEINSLKAISESSVKLNDALSYAALDNDYNYWENSIRSISAITPQDISQTARKFLDLNKVAICVAHKKPEEERLATAKAVSFGRSVNPEQTIVDEINKVKEYRLANNIETMIIPGNQYAKSSVGLDFRTDELDGVSREGIEILTRLLNRGSGQTSKEAFDEIKLQKDIGIFFAAGNNGLSVTASSYDDNLQDTLSLIKEVLSNPNFSQAEFDAEKKKVFDEIMAEEKNPVSKIEEEFFKGTRSYASKEQRLKELEALTLDDVRNLYALIMSTSKVNAALTGPVEEKPYLQDVFNAELSTNMGMYRPYTKDKSPSYYTYTPNTEAKMFVQADDVNQANISVAYKYQKPENASDIAKIRALNTILGGSMNSRLFADMRENRKLAYSVWSEIESNKDTQMMILSIGTTTDSPDPNEGSPENVNKSLEGFDYNINLLRTQNVSEGELEKAKKKIKASLLTELEQNYSKGFCFSDQKSSVYDIQLIKEIYDAVDALTPDDIKNAANYVFKDAPVTSIVANQRTLDALNLK